MDDIRETYKKRRYEVMTEEQIEDGNKFIDYYKSAWQDKEQRGLFDKWEEIDLYWEGEVNLPESDSDPGSNTNIIHPNVEGQVAMLVEQNIAIMAQPQSPSDMPFSKTVSQILEWVKEKNKLKRKLDVHERRREKFGTGVFRVLFDPDALNGFGLPVIEPVNPAYVFVDPSITNVYKIQDARFIIETVNKSINWAKKNFDEDRANSIMPGFDIVEDWGLFGEDDGENDNISRDTYLHLFVWIKDDDGLRLVQMSSDGVILSDSKDEEDYFPNDQYPYFFTPLYFREGMIWGKGDAELLINTQNLIDDLDDQIRINARLTGNVQKVIGKGSNIDIDKWTNEPGLNVPADDVNDWRLVEPKSMPAYIINRRQEAMNIEVQKQTRFSDQMFGGQQKGVDTATEALTLQQAGSVGIDHKKLLLQETLSELFEYILSLIKEYYTEEQAFRITEKQNEFIWFKGSSLKEVPYLIPASDSYKGIMRQQMEPMGQVINEPEYMQLGNETKEAFFDVEVTVGAGLPNNKAFVYTVIKEVFASGAIDKVTYLNLLRDYVKLPIEEIPQQQMDPQLMQQLMGQLTPNPNMQGLSPQGNVSQPMPSQGGMMPNAL